ncbi:MAG: AmmeMemoRadiSam system protein B, partial [Candidatus Eisenbacteria bacterium]|nr:AmmeMemoRadiSam system protein B [Candidatus Eisenbacteria bacterium]
IVYGVGHQLWGDTLALTRKAFETPFGPVACDTEFVDALAAPLGDIAYHGELVHRDEHSIEFQLLYLKRWLGERPIRLVPILLGGFHAILESGRTPAEVAPLEALLGTLRETEARLGGPTLHVAGIDLSHVGPRFGDPTPDPRILSEVELKDRAALEAALRGEAQGWYDTIASHADSTRVCGWGATYAMLRGAVPGPGRLLHYEASSEEDGTVVTVAAAVWP